MTENAMITDELAERVRDFFADYATALLARDESRVAERYAVPALIVFPGQSTAVTDAGQTAEFFAASWSQYDGVFEAEPTIALLAAGPAGVWADVGWSYDGSVRERFCYQLVPAGRGFRIAVLTPLS